MRIVVSGGTGFIGAALCAALVDAGHTVQALTRQAEWARGVLPPPVEVLRWDPPALSGPWVDAVRGADGVVNLAGENLAGGRWTARRKAELRQSRLESTRALVEAIALAPEPERPSVLVSASAVGYYGGRGDEPLTEASPPGTDLLARLCVDWEAAARRAEPLGTRVVLIRTGVVLGRTERAPGLPALLSGLVLQGSLGASGSALHPLALQARFFVGGPLGSGQQWVSWIHLQDEVGVIQHALEQGHVRGPLNATAPNPVRMQELAAEVARTLRRPSWLPVPAVALKALLGEMAEAVLLSSQRAQPAATLSSGYAFRFPDLGPALRDIL